jgi:hypothetical protein
VSQGEVKNIAIKGSLKEPRLKAAERIATSVSGEDPDLLKRCVF